MPRKTRASNKAAQAAEGTSSPQSHQAKEARSDVTAPPPPLPTTTEGASTSRASASASEDATSESDPASAQGEEVVRTDRRSRTASAKSKAKGKSTAITQGDEDPEPDHAVASATAEDDEAVTGAIEADAVTEAVSGEQGSASVPASSKVKLTMEERKEKMNALKKKMAQSSTQNRRDLALDKQARTNNVRDATNSRKLAKAEQTLDRLDAEQRGEDWERMRNWNFTIEDGERWEEMQARGEETQDKGMIDPNALAARSYARRLKSFKPDLKTYQRTGDASAPSSSTSTSLIKRGGGDGSLGASQQVVRKEDVYAGVNSLSYGDHKPNDLAIDRVVSHMNLEIDLRRKRSRKRPVEEGGEVTYINEKNQKFNQKIGRYFDEYTQEIRENFERGTAL